MTRSRSAPSFSYPAPAPSPLSPATPVIQSLKSSKISQRGSCRKVRCKACSSIRSHCQVQGLLLLSGICWLFFCVCLFFKEKENKPKTQQQQTNSSYSSCPPPFKSRSNTWSLDPRATIKGRLIQITNQTHHSNWRTAGNKTADHPDEHWSWLPSFKTNKRKITENHGKVNFFPLEAKLLIVTWPTLFSN